MVVAHRLVEELLVAQVELGAALRGTEDDRHHRFALRRGTRPRPGEDELALWHHFPVDAGHFVVIALRAAEADAEAPADPHIELGEGDTLLPGRTPPALYRLRVRPRPVDLLRRDRVEPVEGEERPFFDLHDCSSSCWYR